MEENLQQLEATYGAPASLFERSAAARAKASGSTAEAVIASWVGSGGADSPAVPAAEVSPPSGAGGGRGAADGGGQADPPAGAPSGAALLAAVAEARGMPESLIERSAKARAGATGGSVDAVFQEWATEEGLTATEPSAVPVDQDPSPEVSSPSGGGGSGGAADGGGQSAALSGAALLAAVAVARKMPESLVERSAKARAKQQGGSVDDVLQEWATEEGIELGGAVAVPPAEGPGDAEKRSDDAGGQSASSAAVESGPVLSGAALLTAVAEARGLPESLTERSAAARAKTAGVDLDDVLREWAEEEGLDVGAAAGVPPAEGRGDAEERSDDAGGPDEAPVASGASVLAAVAAARKMPESLVERSAKARAKQQGGSVDDVLAEWAAEEGIEVGGAVAVPPAEGPGDAEERSNDAGGPVSEPAKAAIPSPVEDVIEEPEPEEPRSLRSRYPAWLAAVLIVVPLLAVLYVVVVPNQPTCGSAGQLAIDPATGEAVSCDGGAYGVDEVSNFSASAEIYVAACAVCHGVNGGGGAGPAMAGGAVLEAFPVDSCSSQIEWIALGSSDWPDATYGANNTPVAGGMPGFEGQLTEAEIAQVTLYERVEFGGLEVEAVESECGFEAVDAEG